MSGIAAFQIVAEFLNKISKIYLSPFTDPLFTFYFSPSMQYDHNPIIPIYFVISAPTF